MVDILNQLAAMPLATLVALGAVVLIGLPHGALDGAIALRIGLLKDVRSTILFLAVYVSGSVAVVLTWLAMPVFTLCVFLVASLLHFGLGDARTGKGLEKGLEVCAHGGLVIAGISQFHRAEVDIIFGYLVNGDTAFVWNVLDRVSFAVVAAVLFCFAKAFSQREWRSNAVELVLIGGLFWLSPPLVGFALYFCLVHAARHVQSISHAFRNAGGRRIVLTQAVVFTLACWCAAGGAFWGLAQVGPVDAALLRVVFIGLAALTLPHIVLVDGVLDAAWIARVSSRRRVSLVLPRSEPCDPHLASSKLHSEI